MSSAAPPISMQTSMFWMYSASLRSPIVWVRSRIASAMPCLRWCGGQSLIQYAGLSALLPYLNASSSTPPQPLEKRDGPFFLGICCPPLHACAAPPCMHVAEPYLHARRSALPPPLSKGHRGDGPTFFLASAVPPGRHVLHPPPTCMQANNALAIPLTRRPQSPPHHHLLQHVLPPPPPLFMQAATLYPYPLTRRSRR